MSRLLFAHATGFSSGVWDPVVAEVGAAQVLDLPGHGATPEPGRPFTWWTFGHYLLAEAAPGSIGVGHSMGGAALLMAEATDPGRFSALVLVEPIVFAEGDQAMVEAMAAQAERRRSHWPDRETARAHLAAKPVFSRWHPAAMDGYLRTGLGDDPAGGVRLRCRPRFEAEVYRLSHSHRMWDRLGEVHCPVLVLAGTESDTYRPEDAARLAGRLPGGRFRLAEGTGHFLPMERPELVVAAIEEVAAHSAE